MDGPHRWVQQIRSDPPEGLDDYVAGFETFFDRYAGQAERWSRRNRGYHDAITALARFYVPPGVRVLEIGCGLGDLLAALQPSVGVGIDVSGSMIGLATRRHPSLRFHHMAAERLELHELQRASTRRHSRTTARASSPLSARS